jgi:hypothetical protein
MLVTPDRSERIPPIAAKRSGAVERRVAASKVREKKERSSSRVGLLGLRAGERRWCYRKPLPAA